MATYGTQKVLAGTQSVRYPDPKIKGTANEFGLYQWSAFDALLASGLKPNGFISALADLPNASAVDVLVFTSDIPALASAVVTDVTAGLQFSKYVSNALTCEAAKSTSGGAVAASIAQYGQVLSGYAGSASDVLVTGFPLSFVSTNPGAEGVEDTVFLQVVANSPVINGVVGPLVGNTAAAPSPIILDASVYTQAIKDNGNILQASPTAPQYQVVGLYTVIPD